MTVFRDRFIDEYLAECDEHLMIVKRDLLVLEESVGRTRPPRKVIEELFRSFHSLKGLAGMVEDRQGELLAHEMESYLRALRDGDVPLTTNGIEVLIDGTRALEEAIAARGESREAPSTAGPLAKLRALTAATADSADGLSVTVSTVLGAEAGGAVWECLFTPSPALIARGVNVDLVRSRLSEGGEIVSAAPIVAADGAVAFRFLVTGELSDAQADVWRADGMICTRISQGAAVVAESDAPVAAVSDAAAGTGMPAGHFVRVDLAKLDELMRMIGDLVILRARLSDTLGRIEGFVPPAEWRMVQENATGIERQLRELRDGVMGVRLVPVGEIFRRMPFVVRDVARETGRIVTVELSGQDTEIDKFLVERMMDPVLHLVRNAVSHGLEGTAERIAAGKRPEGTVSLSASAAGEIVTIEVADDGRGVDAARVLARARGSGLDIPGDVDDAALLQLICSPGFSTREESDRVSGRGFGMAVVQSTVHELGGSMRMVSELGRGTRFIMDLPLTLAITDALIARVGSQTYAIPQAAVREVVEVDGDRLRRVEGGEVTPYRGAAVPVIRLASALGVATSGANRFHAFVVGSGAATVALLVDRVVGQREIVVRSTVDPLIRVDGIAGATDLGDGRAVLILDAAAIARRARGGIGRSGVAAREIA